MKEFFKNSFAKVYYDEILDALFIEYISKVPNDEQFILVNKALLEAFTKLKTQKVVADIRKMGIISLASQEWIVKNLFPALLKHLNGKTLYHAQLLDAKEILSKVSAANIKNKSAHVMDGFEVRQFTDETELKSFLKSLIV